MKVVPFIAESPAAALAQIHQQLGPEAVVVSVRPLPRQGLARLWGKRPTVEVLACVAEPARAEDSHARDDEGMALGLISEQRCFGVPTRGGSALKALYDGCGRPHVFIGPPGTGKTTLLCKWMTLAVLNENRTAKLWRLDGASANTAEFLSIYGEMLGVPIERFWDSSVQRTVRPDGFTLNEDVLFIDVPGVQPGDGQAMGALGNSLASLPTPRIHLVLNAAYEISILSEQIRAFARFKPEDLSFTHLDEEKRQGKLHDLIVGTNCSLRFLSTGQKIPGDLVFADADLQVCPEFVA